MGVSVRMKRRGRALRAWITKPENVAALAATNQPPLLQIREPKKDHVYPEQLNRDLHTTSKYYAVEARKIEERLEASRHGQ